MATIQVNGEGFAVTHAEVIDVSFSSGISIQGRKPGTSKTTSVYLSDKVLWYLVEEAMARFPHAGYWRNEKERDALKQRFLEFTRYENGRTPSPKDHAWRYHRNYKRPKGQRKGW